MTEQTKNYKTATKRIQEIVDIIENREPDIDDMTLLVKEATDLIHFCKKKLKTAENDLTSSLEKLDTELE